MHHLDTVRVLMEAALRHFNSVMASGTVRTVLTKWDVSGLLHTVGPKKVLVLYFQ